MYENYLLEEDFEDFDAEDFDTFEDMEDMEDMARAAKGAGRGLKTVKQKVNLYEGISQLNLSINNAGATAQKVELFNSMRSISKAANASITALTPFAAKDRAAANLNNFIFWDELGNLVFQNGAGGQTTISCKEIPYRALLDASMVSPFLIAKSRMVFSTDPQIDETLEITNSSFLGKKASDSINPRSFFDPNQQQNLTVDVKQSLKIDRETGINYNVLNGNNVRITLFIPRYRKAAMRA